MADPLGTGHIRSAHPSLHFFFFFLYFFFFRLFHPSLNSFGAAHYTRLNEGTITRNSAILLFLCFFGFWFFFFIANREKKLFSFLQVLCRCSVGNGRGNGCSLLCDARIFFLVCYYY